MARLKVPDFVPKSVAFVGAPADTIGSKEDYLAGTCFFIGRVSPRTNLAHVYLITARHVVNATLQATGGKVYIRLNHNDWGGQWIDTVASDWIMGPAKIDAAVLAFMPALQNIDHTVIPAYSMATQARLRENNQSVDLGDDLIISGLFIHHYGQQRNIPIVRIGNVATLLEHDVAASLGPGWHDMINAYLIEARSIGGLSGSPVFVHRLEEGTPTFALLGLMQGHYGTKAAKSGEAANEESVNVGIGIVVPADDLEEVFRQPEIIELEERLDDATLAQS